MAWARYKYKLLFSIAFCCMIFYCRGSFISERDTLASPTTPATLVQQESITSNTNVIHQNENKLELDDQSKYEFSKQMCADRKLYMNWTALATPCKDQIKFGQNLTSRTLATDPAKSVVFSKTIRPTGDYSSVDIKTFDISGLPKTFGGDEWRIFLWGPSNTTAMVHDQLNGHYQATFLLLEPGRYELRIHLQDTLCDSYMDPPDNWFKSGKEYFVSC